MDHNFTPGELFIIRWQYGELGDFLSALIEAMIRADDDNLRKLALGFPEEVEALCQYRHEDGWWDKLEQRAIEAGIVPHVPTIARDYYVLRDSRTQLYWNEVDTMWTDLHFATYYLKEKILEAIGNKELPDGDVLSLDWLKHDNLRKELEVDHE